MVKKWFRLFVLSLIAAFGLSAAAQESAVKGNIDGVVIDATGASVPGATVTASHRPMREGVRTEPAGTPGRTDCPGGRPPVESR